MIKVEGEKGTFVNGTMKARIDNETGYLHIDKTFVGLVMSKLQAEELRKMLNRHSKDYAKEINDEVKE